jgi:hypothetical protein
MKTNDIVKAVLRIGLIAIFSLVMTVSAATAGGVARMTKEELKDIMDQPDTMILDVRAGRDWKSSEFKIKGAHRAGPSDFAQWAEKYPKDKTLVLYCA